jgi:hypothetical protein
MPDVDNLTFFRIVDKQVREAMQRVETGMLPVAGRALADTELLLQDHPVEGYYGKTPELRGYFNHIRTLQLNSSDQVTDAVRQLHNFYSNDVFGLGQAVRTAINSDGVWYPSEPVAVISPRVDPLTVAILNVAREPTTVKRELTIENVARAAEDTELGVGLVGLGILVDKTERGESGEYNPIATTLARETTVLSAYVPTKRCMSQYSVSPEVEEQGNRVIDAYNTLFSASGSDVRIDKVTQRNAFRLNKNLPEMDRCVRIFNLELPRQDKECYHWAVGKEGREFRVVDFWRKEVVTTDMFKRAPGQYQAQREA